ncbi:MAG: hypothetical protein HKN87_12825 [Saprospiraceae bacterium]|nr:hypothetical protein [Saprospiraceae bacterium]
MSSFLFRTLIIFLVVAGCDNETSRVDCENIILSFEVQIVDSECGLAQGSIVVIPEVGSGIMRFKLDDGPFSSVGSFRDLLPGVYSITVENADGCFSSKDVLVRSGISYKDEVEPIIRVSCAISGCHDGISNVDYRVFSNFNPGDMKARTQSRNMPKEGTLTQDEIDAIACWVDDGALNN